jgi:tetratricopeptide (TPR) repeat protein
MRSDNPKADTSDSSRSAPAPTSSVRDAFNNAIRLHQAGRLDDAEKIYRRVLEVQSDHFDSLHMLGVVDIQRRNYAEAVRKINSALELNPNLGEAFNNRGTALRELKRLDEALASHDKAIALKPDYAEAFNNRGNVLLELKCFDEALASYDRAIALKPDYAEAFHNRGAAAKELKRLDEALACYDKAIGLNPYYANAFNSRGNVLMEQRSLHEALASYDKAIALKPDHATAFYNRGTALRELKRLDDALASYDRAIGLRADYADAFNSRGMLKLLRGRYHDGWSDYEWRWRLRNKEIRPTINAPDWQGEDLADRRIAIYPELHFGDVIQFARYLPLLNRRGANVTFLAPARLIRLFRPLSPEIALVTSVDGRASFDFQCALMSLPRWFGTELSSIPNQTPFLSAERDLVARWKNKIGEVGFRIGIAWQGTPQWTFDRRRFPLTEIVPLLRLPDVRFISLQKNDGVDQLKDLPVDTKVEALGDFDNGSDGFIDTAAVMENLDLIITSDTSIAHLAGALGRPTWVALKYVPDWRWLLDRDDSPWYPTMRLFRQETDGDWKSVFAKMERDLRSLLDR